MTKMLKRTIVMCLSLLLCTSCLSPFALAASSENDASDSVINLEYQEYIASKDYYTSLAKGGYTLVIHVGEEYEAAELERIAADSTSAPDILKNNSMLRGLYIPTYKYNVLTGGKKTIDGTCNDSLGYLFTNYIYCGCTAYEVSLYNRGSSTLNVDLVKSGSTSSFLSYKVPSKSTVIKYVSVSEWYGRFANPCSVSGYVARDV